MKQFLDNIFSMFYPRLCVGCGNALRQNEELLCTHCLLHLPETHYHQQQENPLRNVFAGRVPVREVTSLMFYNKGSIVQHILHHLKYKGKKEVGRYLGRYYGQQLRQEERFRSVDYILPIPLHPRKQRKRGYNQSEWIAMGLSEGLGKPYLTDVLVRTHFTDTQTKKSRFNRWENVKEVFAVQNPEKIRYKHVLVCDDVLTTGATMEAAIQHLIEVEGVTVSVVTLATASH
jgi:ComF family protein